MFEPESIKNKRIGFSVLNWGLGHVTRCVSLIEQLKRQSNSVFVFCNQEQRSIFRQYIKEVEFIDHKGYPFDFRGKGNFKLDLFRSLFALYSYAKKDSEFAKESVQLYDLDLIISDQRYGFFTSQVPSIFITHQLTFPLRGIYGLFNIVNRKEISKFDTVWVMDNHEHLAGSLSFNKRIKHVVHIGHHSRFLLLNIDQLKSIKSVLIINGPRIYSRYLLDQFEKQLCSDEIEYVIGNPDNQKDLDQIDTKATFIPNTDMARADEVMASAKVICGYFGYSTLMDCRVLKCSYDLIPTPGQLEQVYLAKLHKKSS